MTDFALLKKYQDQIKNLEHQVIDLKQQIKDMETKPYCPNCGCTELLCGHNGPKGCTSRSAS